MIRVRIGWRDNLFFRSTDDALLHIKSLMQSMNAVKSVNLEFQIVDRAEWEWEHGLDSDEKKKYVSIDHYRQGVEKGDRQYEIEAQYEEEKRAYNESKGEGEEDFPYWGKWLNEKGLKEEYEFMPVNQPVDVPDDVDPDLEIVHDYREGNMP